MKSMQYILRYGLLTGFAFMFACPLAAATDIRYYQLAGIRGVLSERQGVDCCIDGKETKVKFPVIELSSPVNVLPLNPAKPEVDEMIEVGVVIMQLAMDADMWKFFNKNKGKSTRVLCEPFHSFNGHHMTSVICNVKGFGDF